MGEKLVVGPIDRGLRTDRTPFNIDNDSFPTLINAYQWRGRVKRKRGTDFLNRLAYTIAGSPSIGNTDGSGNLNAANIFTTLGLSGNEALVPGSFTITVAGPNVFTEPNPPTGDLNGSAGGSGTINYATGAVTLTGTGFNGAAVTITAGKYYPDLPVMGIEDLVLTTLDYPGTLAFDTKYAYNVTTTAPYSTYNVNFYKNPAASAPYNYTNYVAKGSQTSFNWNGQNYQQFWTTNYESAFWATNGITIQFTTTNIGMQFKAITNVAIIAATGPAVADLTIGANSLAIGDFVFVNEVVGITGINWQTGYVTATGNPVRVTFPNAILAGAYSSGGICQFLTRNSDSTKDCLKWYDGDPTPGPTGPGWVNFMPPLSQAPYSIAGLPVDQYYLVGARMIVPFKDRLLCFAPVVQSKTAGPFYLQDTVIYSQNGTPYYTASFNYTGLTVDTPASAAITWNPILTPVGTTATANSWFQDQTGFGGFLSAGVNQDITTVNVNEDALIVGFFDNLQTRFIYTGNSYLPFNFFIINSELGSSSTFSAINMDQGVITRGARGFIMTSQTTCTRIDLDILPQQFQINNLNNGSQRLCAQRDFINEWIYFTYNNVNVDVETHVFPSQTLLFNYRDNSWAIFNESYTTYGSFRKKTGNTWNNIGNVYPTWDDWDDPWDSGESQALQPNVLGGTSQGFLIIKGVGTGEEKSIYIKSFSSSTVVSPDHMLNTGDFIIISGCLGTIGPLVNGFIFQVHNATRNSFDLGPSIGSGTYLGGGYITRMYVPQIQTKQFPTAWGLSKKTRIGPQMYLLTKTENAQITLQIFLSQDGSDPYNDPPIVPSANVTNSSLIYSNILYTCPESTNLGLTPANINLQMVTASRQAQIWHRMNTSLIGDTVQIGFTLSDDQMTSMISSGVFYDITGASNANPCIINTTAAYAVGTLVQISDVIGMTQLNGGPFYVTASDASTVTINLDSTNFYTYVSGGTITSVKPDYQFAEIELHGFILDVTPSMWLS